MELKKILSDTKQPAMTNIWAFYRTDRSQDSSEELARLIVRSHSGMPLQVTI